MDINKIVTEFYNPEICAFRGSVSAGEETDNCLADAETYKLRFCRCNNGGKSEVEAAYSLHLQGRSPVDIAKIIIDTRKSGGF